MRRIAAVGILPVCLVFLTGCHAWNHTYDPMPLGEVGYVEEGTGGLGAADCPSCENDPPWKRYTLWGRIKYAATCGSGCGEWYWGEWHYDPPPTKGCDRCDQDGHYIGPQPCADCRPGWFAWLRGHRDGSGCPSCGVVGEHDCAVPPPVAEWETVSEATATGQ